MNVTPNMQPPLQVGLIGTGYAAKLRAETLKTDPRAELVVVAGHTHDNTVVFSHTYDAEAAESWEAVIDRPELDLVIVATINRDHGAIVQAALKAGKHVVVEYPLSLEVAEAQSLIALAQSQGKLLHVEHIELLSGLHQAIRQSLPTIGTPVYARYATVNPQHPAPQRWTYHPELFGFPLVGALSRLHRLTDLFGTVTHVHCQTHYWLPAGFGAEHPYYKGCVCSAQLRFASGLLAEVLYGKGETFWQASRTLEIQGEHGALMFQDDQGTLIQGDQSYAIDTGSRRGMFAKDTTMVLDHLFNQTPLYVTAESSLQALRVAEAARLSAETGQVVEVATLR